ncbi:hypothetical protein J7M28_06940 [bacterium]|nr:hypothetical protein [bacterium]
MSLSTITWLMLACTCLLTGTALLGIRFNRKVRRKNGGHDALRQAALLAVVSFFCCQAVAMLGVILLFPAEAPAIMVLQMAIGAAFLLVGRLLHRRGTSDSERCADENDTGQAKAGR